MHRRTLRGLAPLLLPYCALFCAGMALTLAQSLGLFLPLGTGEATLDHYRTLLQDPAMAQSLGLSLFVALVSAAGSVLGGTVLALALWRMPPGLRRVGVVSKVGLILPHVAVAFLVLLFLGRTGLVSSALFQTGLIASPEEFPNILHTGSGLGMIMAFLIKGVPFALLLIGAVLFGFDVRLVQTARMLGAGPWRTFWSVTLPRLLPAMHSAFIILFLYAFGSFDIPFVLGESHPGMLSIRVYDIFFQRDLDQRPLAMAILTLMFLFAGLFAMLYNRFAAYLDGWRRKL
ncbi:putative spermidine/putrescine transport system permease protein [Desulfomicrobium macestii]|uniref:Spermidine/putrescine transport system permease protein n=2 Tax=Desulfomicrobium TaxID=898 RepID=A0ABR9H3D3_9BACT|nr:ABC transporter permease subunit [Desulfomicrobium macestii]MBE1425053.1 putative spermidine/putrescine transport system permease protein [Desulfomicrobium macestii]